MNISKSRRFEERKAAAESDYRGDSATGPPMPGLEEAGRLPLD
jgi:hypothetical protein